jgi:adenylate cyclase
MTAARRLAAIMAIDVVGYSRLMGEDEAGTAQAVREHREAARPIVAGPGGRIVKTMGDGLLLEFPSVVAAVECAIAIQKLMIERNADIPEAKRIVYRIGVNLGDVLIEGDDILGDGVNIAARLEAECEPGGVLISSAAYDQTRGKIDAGFVDVGEKTLKNIAAPVRVYSLQVGVPAVARSKRPSSKTRSAPAVSAVTIAALSVILALGAWRYFGSSRPAIEAASEAPARLSIVVLPFANVSGDPSQDYLADALGDGLTTYVSRIPGTFVIAHNTALTYKGKPTDVKVIGKELGVRYALEGSVQPTANRIRVNAQLIDTDSGAHLWAETFDEDRGDLLQAEDDIVTRLARSLDIQLAAVESARAGRLRPENPDAQDLAERCVAAYNASAAVDNDSIANAAIYEPCEQALRLDPHNIVAMHYIAIRLIRSLQPGAGGDLASVTARLAEFGSRATELSPDDSYTHNLIAVLAETRGQYDKAIMESERALVSNPSNMGAYLTICYSEDMVGNPAKAVECADKAMRLSPHDPFLVFFLGSKGLGLLLLGRDAEALANFEQALSIAPDFKPYVLSRVLALANLGRDQEAREALKRYATLPGNKIESLNAFRAYYAARYGADPTNRAWVERAIEGLRKAGMPEQ